MRLVGGDVVTTHYFDSSRSACRFVDVDKGKGGIHQQRTTGTYEIVSEPSATAFRPDGVGTDDGQPKHAKSRNNPNGRDRPEESRKVQDGADG